MNQASSFWVVIAVLALCALGAYWYYQEQPQPAEQVTVPIVPDDSAAEPEEPRFPVPPAMPAREQPANLEPLPALDESDQYFGLALASVFGEGVLNMLADEALIEKFVATIDNLPRKTVADRIKPVSGVQGPFSVDGQDGAAEFTIDTSSYNRYDFLVNLMATADQAALVDTYRRFYPLFQEAYIELGYPNGHFNDRVVEVIDHLLTTPEVDDPLRLVRPHVLYEYADPEIEALSAGQKLLIRTGPEHSLRIKQFLEEMRERLSSIDANPR